MVFLVFLCLLFQSSSYAGEKIHDISRLETVEVSKISRVQELAEIQNLMKRAVDERKKVSIAGARHSQGGHTFSKDGLVLDMTRFNRVLGIDQKEKIITVESGATWDDVQAFANKHGLAVKVMQSSNIFTVGGSLSVNAHGRDPRFGSIIETVEGFRLLTAYGTIKKVSRKENPELFQLVIGGLGLFGVILDVDLSLTTNDIYQKTVTVIPAKDYPEYFLKKVKANENIGLHFAWPSIAPKTLMDEILIANYEKTKKDDPELNKLKEEGLIPFNTFFLKMSRKFHWGKSLRWYMQKKLLGYHGAIISRNNAMRPEVKFLDYVSPKDTDILQEYFFPVKKYDEFMEELKKIIQTEKINLLSMTLRYVPKANGPYLRYAGEEDFFSAVLYVNQGLSTEEVNKASSWTQKIVDLALSVGGRYYLAYQRYPTREQLRQAYPQIDSFFAQKLKWDETEMFSSRFYEYYKQVK